MQYSDFRNIWRSQCTWERLFHELMEDIEFKHRNSKFDDEIKQKNTYYFIYAMWYI